ncbi:MAG TPA: LytTR family DNA-binding domain-containing protein [Vicinamibacteria bacterium]|nr:LytTR family DNA-binding domain-containing protein [Vicinamibacteria bacterium]
MPLPGERLLLHLGRDRRRAIDPGEVYFLEAVGQRTLVRLRSPTRLVDARAIGDVLSLLAPFGVVRVHRNHAVNVRQVLEIRRRGGEADWEVKLEPPVNAVLPVGRTYLKPLWTAFGEGDPRRRPATGPRRSRKPPAPPRRDRPRGR